MLFLVDNIARFARKGGAWPSVEWRETSSHFGRCGHIDFERVRDGKLATPGAGISFRRGRRRILNPTRNQRVSSMIAAQIPKPQLKPHEERRQPAVESASSSGKSRGLKEVLVETLVRMRNSKEPPPSIEPDSEQDFHCAQYRSRPRVGRELGPYRLLEWLGRGAEGDVWKAVRREPVEELVALKILKPSLASNPARKAQFRHEAERGGWLVGPALLTVLELNEIDGYHFMALPYVEGTALRDVVKWRREYLSGDDTRKVHPFVTMSDEDYLAGMTRTLAKAARALASVHDQRIAHRDIKPANILLDNLRSEGVYLCDFGLGRDLDVATAEQMRDGAGTPLYMAPERLLRLCADEIKCDIYSMGVTLCEALTLDRPFRVPEDLALPALAPFLASAEPIPPSVLDPQFPADLEATIMKAMARDPRDRHDSAALLAGDLERFASDWSMRCSRRAKKRQRMSAARHAYNLRGRVMAVLERARRSLTGNSSRANPAPDQSRECFNDFPAGWSSL
jgi:eukaryotic-like serine/threonine-protein kinase